MWLICGDGKCEKRSSAQSKSGNPETNDSAAFQKELRGFIADSRRMGVKERTLMAPYQTFRVDKLCPSDYSVRETWYGDEVQRQYLSTIQIWGAFKT
jgi:hypothetical protein